MQRIDIEGYARQSAAGELRVGGFLVELPRGASPETLRPPDPNARVRIEAIVRDRHVIVEHMGAVNDLPALPPVPDREPRAVKGGPGNVGRANHQDAPPDQPRQDERRGPAPPPRDQGMMGPAAIGVGDVGVPARPDRPDRPAPPQLPDRPQRPEPPARPDRPQLPDRPPRPERPDMRGRP